MPAQAEGHTGSSYGSSSSASSCSTSNSCSITSSTSYAPLYPLQQTWSLHRRLPMEERDYHYALGGTSTATTSRVPTSAAFPAYSTCTAAHFYYLASGA